MRITMLSFFLMFLVVLSPQVQSGGFKGGGGGGARVGGGGGGGGRMGSALAGGGRGGSMPNLGGGGGGMNMPAARPMPRPTASAPSVSRPSFPQSRPSQPNFNTGAGSAIAAGMKPSVRPADTRPETRPTSPSFGNRPSTLPGSISTLPGSVRPSNRPTTLPGTPGTRPSFPDLGSGNLANRPTTLPGRPSTLPDRPSTLPGRPSTLPNRPSTLPGRPGISDRPTTGDLGNFLGIPGGIRPETLPGRLPNRPGNSANDWFSGQGVRPGRNPRPIDIGNIAIGNTVINNRPSWTSIDRNQFNQINNRWQNQVGSLHGWGAAHPNRVTYWNSWGNNVRTRWSGYQYHGNWFTGNWWYGHNTGICHWHYYHRFNSYPWVYWWQQPTWPVATSWFTWSAPATVWSQPVYYDYGTGGNVIYQDNSVYINGQQVASAREFAESAAILATVTPPASQEQASSAEWLPLGTFALSTSQADVEPTRVVQLAVDKSGIIAGTMYNTQTDQAAAIQGQVDRDTQRVAFRIGEGDQVVAETGLANLTQDQAPLLVHFGPDRRENYLLIRLEESSDELLGGVR